jgi:hypothetical protein
MVAQHRGCIPVGIGDLVEEASPRRRRRIFSRRRQQIFLEMVAVEPCTEVAAADLVWKGSTRKGGGGWIGAGRKERKFGKGGMRPRGGDP